MKIELDLTKEEFFEVLDATHKEHWDWRKRDFKHNIYLKLKEVTHHTNADESDEIETAKLVSEKPYYTKWR